MTSPAIVSNPFRAGYGNGASSGYQARSDNVELRRRPGLARENRGALTYLR